MRANLDEKFSSVLVPEKKIEDAKIDAGGRKDFQSGRGVCGSMHLIVAPQLASKRVKEWAIVIDEQKRPHDKYSNYHRP
jgi:hypothetical protein